MFFGPKINSLSAGIFPAFLPGNTSSKKVVKAQKKRKNTGNEYFVWAQNLRTDHIEVALTHGTDRLGQLSYSNSQNTWFEENFTIRKVESPGSTDLDMKGTPESAGWVDTAVPSEFAISPRDFHALMNLSDALGLPRGAHCDGLCVLSVDPDKSTVPPSVQPSSLAGLACGDARGDSPFTAPISFFWRIICAPPDSVRLRSRAPIRMVTVLWITAIFSILLFVHVCQAKGRPVSEGGDS